MRIRTLEIDGYTVLYGRDALSNDYLTTVISEPTDIWMHATGVAGSHLIIRHPDPPEEVILKCALIAKENSKGKYEKKQSVIVTTAEKVLKPDSFPIGKVLVNHAESKIVVV